MSEVQRRHEMYMRQALQLAEQAALEGEIPVGCVIVHNIQDVGVGRNSVQGSADPTGHAELTAIQSAVATIGEKFLTGATLYVTLEPCAMCAGAILLSRIGTVVYGATESKTGAVRSVFEILDNTQTNHQCIVRSGVLEQECGDILKAFFEAQRQGRTTAADTTTIESTSLAESVQKKGTLFLVPTPIGNLGDITRRAISVLTTAHVVYCEDTRHTGMLLKHLGIRVKQLLSNHDHNERQRADEIVKRVAAGEKVALVSDAGMPGISDPGFRAVQACVDAGLIVTALPGASAATTALAASGLPTDAWYFAGFAPQKKGRLTFVQSICQRVETVVMYESPHRIGKLLDELLTHAGRSRRVVVARELTKLHEEYLRGTLQQVVSIVQQRGGLKGECVIVLEGYSAPPSGTQHT